MTNLLTTATDLERLMALDPGQALGLGEAHVTVEYSAPGCPEGAFIVTSPAGIERAWFTSPMERMDQAEALAAEFSQA